MELFAVAAAAASLFLLSGIPLSVSVYAGSGPLTSLCPRTVKCEKKSVVARGAPDGDAHHKGRYLLHPAGTEAVLASAPRPRCGDTRHGFTVHRPEGWLAPYINQ